MATAEIVRLLNTGIEFQKALVDQAAKVATMNITAKNEQIHEQLTIDEADIKWNLELFQYGANLIAAVSGGTGVSTKKPSKGTSALAGALSGAATGAAVGSMVLPGWGTAIGAGVGAIAGGVMGGM